MIIGSHCHSNRTLTLIINKTFKSPSCYGRSDFCCSGGHCVISIAVVVESSKCHVA